MQNSPANHDVILLYRNLVERGEIIDDPAQRLVVEKLSLLARRLDRPANSHGFASALFGWGRERVEEGALKGLYIYGSVGRGKSMLMNLFVDSIGKRAYRVHFYEFMQSIQKELTKLRQKNISDPIAQIGARISRESKVICLDEMQIENIADAMIVGRLFEAIFAGGAVLVTTSNRHPDELYKSGLNRHRFTPFIKLLIDACEVLDLAGEQDYRLVGEGGEERYFVGDKALLDPIWAQLAPKEEGFDLMLAGRVWHLPRYHQGAARLSFAALCEEARGAADYQALVKVVDRLIIDDVPILTARKTSAASRFITLIDILYEANTKLYMGLNAPLNALHKDRSTAFVFERTLSRLEEMSKEGWGEV